MVVSVEAGRIFYGYEIYRGEKDPREFTTELRAYDLDFNLLWTWTPPQPHNPDSDGLYSVAEIYAQPLPLEDGSVVVASANCYVYHLSAEGEVLWWDRHPYRFTSESEMVRYRDLVYAISSRDPVKDDVYNGMSRIRAYRLPREVPGP